MCSVQCGDICALLWMIFDYWISLIQYLGLALLTSIKIFTTFCYVNFHSSDTARSPTSCSDLHNYCFLFVFGSTAPPPPQWARTSSFARFLDHTQWRNTVGSTPLDEWSARRRDPYLTTHNTHNRETSMPAVGFFLMLYLSYCHTSSVSKMHSSSVVR